MIFKVHRPFIIETDYASEKDFFKSYLEDSRFHWVDSNVLYEDYISNATGGASMKLFFVKNIEAYDLKLKKFVISIFRSLGIKSKDFRCDFFKVLPGGELPKHVDQKSLISVCLPLSKNTGAIYFENSQSKLELCYQKMIILNNKEPHGVRPPTEERLIFRIGIHDVSFDQLLLGLNKKNSQAILREALK